VLDAPQVVRTEWGSAGTEAAIAAYFDRVWIYGDRAVYDPVAEYGLEAIAEKVRYTGYLAPEPGAEPADRSAVLAELGAPDGRFALCVVGGGQDGGDLALAFAGCPFPAGMSGIFVAGPFMPEEIRRHLHQAAERRPDLRVIDFVKDLPPLYATADCIIAMGGYNTVCEVLGTGRRALVVPREQPRVEQLLRAERLAALGVLDVMRADDLGPAALGRWIAASDRPRPAARDRIDLGGLRRIPALIGEAISGVTRQPEELHLAR